MKKAIIIFEGKEILSIEIDRIFEDIETNTFYLKGTEVAFFSKDYGYVIREEQEIKTYVSDEDLRKALNIKWKF
jgi:hypothetical protein